MVAIPNRNIGSVSCGLPGPAQAAGGNLFGGAQYSGGGEWVLGGGNIWCVGGGEIVGVGQGVPGAPLFFLCVF